MRTSRVAKETSRFFDASSAPVLPRRSTRVSLARFAYNATNGTAPSTASDDLEDVKVTIGSDIEDAVKTETPRKRKRTATVVQPSPRRASTRTKTVKTEVKSEIKSEIKTEINPDIKPTIKSEPNSDSEFLEETNPKPRGRVRKPARKTTDASTGTTTIQPPSDWQEIYSLVKEMRLTGPAANAAVDTMGCERLADADATPRDRRFQTLVSLMLSSQTKDTVNAEAMARLKAELPPHMPGAKPGLNLENMLAVEPALLNELIGKVGFHNNKTKYLKSTALLLQSDFASDIPPTLQGLTSLPGVGPKMAHLCMSATNGWNRVEGIGVDVHVHRITNLWGWNTTKNPEETRKMLESWLPRDKWKEINWLLVGFGQKVCLPIGRKCGDCEVGLAGLCRAVDRKKVGEGRKRRLLGVKVEAVKMEGSGGAVVKKEEEEEEEMEVDLERDDVVMVKKEEKTGVVDKEVKGEGEEEVKMEVDRDTSGEVVVKKEEKDEMDIDMDVDDGAVVTKEEEMKGVKVVKKEEEVVGVNIDGDGGGVIKSVEKEETEVEAGFNEVKKEVKMEAARNGDGGVMVKKEEDAGANMDVDDGIIVKKEKMEGVKVERVKIEGVKVEGDEDGDGGAVEEMMGVVVTEADVSPSVKMEDTIG